MNPHEQAPPPIDPGVRIGHVHLRAKDLTAVERFYVGVLGFQVKARLPGAVFLAAGDYHHHLAFNTWESGAAISSTSTPGLYHVALLYPTQEALANALRRLLAEAWPIDGAADHGTHLALYLRDPEGNGLELAWDRPRGEWPLDGEGRIAFITAPMDVDALLAPK